MDQLREEIERLRRERADLEGETNRLRRERDRLREEVKRLTAALESAQRAAKRQAAPFSKGAPTAQPKRPGRKPGPAYGRRTARPRPTQIDERILVPLPERVPTVPHRSRRRRQSNNSKSTCRSSGRPCARSRSRSDSARSAGAASRGDIRGRPRTRSAPPPCSWDRRCWPSWRRCTRRSACLARFLTVAARRGDRHWTAPDPRARGHSQRLDRAGTPSHRANFATVESFRVCPAATAFPWLSTATDVPPKPLAPALRFCSHSSVPPRSNFATVRSLKEAKVF